MRGTSTSQLQYVGLVATALVAAQPATAGTFESFDHPTLPTSRIIKDGQWISSQIKRIEALPSDWDGYGADPIDTGVIHQMKLSLEQMIPGASLPGSIVPGADGSLQAEWHLGSASFGLLIENDGTLSCWVRPANAPEIERFGFAARELFQSAVLTYLS